jgi:hypothetical protein
VDRVLGFISRAVLCERGATLKSASSSGGTRV